MWYIYMTCECFFGFWYVWSISLSWCDSGSVSWPGFERKISQKEIAMHHAMVRKSYSKTVELCSRNESLEVLKKTFTENNDNVASAYADLEIDENIQTLVHAAYKWANTDMGGVSAGWVSWKCSMFCHKTWTDDTLATWLNICRLFVLCYQECLRTNIMTMVNGSQVIGPW